MLWYILKIVLIIKIFFLESWVFNTYNHVYRLHSSQKQQESPVVSYIMSSYGNRRYTKKKELLILKDIIDINNSKLIFFQIASFGFGWKFIGQS